MNFNDIFKSDFLENVAALSLGDILLSLSFALIMGLYIFYIYKLTYSGVLFSANFGLCLIGLTLVTCMLIMTIASNVVLSLGMVGALSIVRFRTAIKEPLDIVFLFWSIASGIVIAAGIIPLAVIGGVLIGLVLYIFNHRQLPDAPYLLIMHLENDYPQDILEDYLKSQLKKYRLKAKTDNGKNLELIYEVRLIKANEAGFTSGLKAMDKVKDCSLVYYNGDYMA